MVASVSDERRNQRTNAEHELLQGRQAPTNTRMRNLGLIQRREHCKHADTHAREEPTAVHVVDVLRARLDATSQ